jgi:hypothetical protein
VVAALAADQPVAPRLAARAMVGERDLERGVGRFRPRIGEEDAAEPFGGDARQPLGELEGHRVAHLESRREVHLRDLALYRLDNFRPAMTGIDAPQARGAVEHLAPFGRPVVHAFGAGKEARRLLELPVGRERHPEGRLLEA